MLRDIRERRGLGLREVARRAPCPASTLSRVERGELRASWRLLSRLAEVLQCPADELARVCGVVPPSVVAEARRAWLEASDRG